MFIHDFVHIPLPYPTVRDRLVSGAASWVSDIAANAYADGEELRVRTGPSGCKPLSKTTRVHFGVAYERHDGIVIPMSWITTGIPGLFSAMEADMEVAPIGGDMTQLTLSGMYAPPPGGVGRSLDTVVLHRVAEASVRSFLHRIADTAQRTPATVHSAGRSPAGSRPVQPHRTARDSS